MNAAVLAVIALVAFIVAYWTYARWIERRVYQMDNDEPTPAHTHTDGVDFVPCGKHVLFGHHFCSVAGAAPIIGPAIAVAWGWLPAFLWIVLGTIFIGAVHDYGALALSAKRGGRTMGDMAGELLTPRSRVYFLSIIVLLTWIVLAVFGFFIAFLFTKFPASVIPVNFEILVALVIGWWVYRRKGSLLWPSVIALVLLYVVVFWSAAGDNAQFGVLSDSLRLGDGDSGSIVTWLVLLLVYSFITSVLPVRVLLQPRDYINSHQLLVGLSALLIGIVVSAKTITAPTFNDPDGAGIFTLIPMLFVTIACGAISGFHGLVSSGTTSKQLDRMRDARHVGYGGMLGEGLLAVVSVIAVSAGLGDWSAAYPDWPTAQKGGLGHFIQGAATFLDWVVSDAATAKTIIAVIVISFAATTLDTATRIQRFCLAELAASFRIHALRNRYLASAVAVVPAACLAIFTQAPGRGPGSGGFLLWSVFGTTNQLIGAITLILLTIYLRKARRPTLPVALPMVFLLVMTTVAGVMVLIEQVNRENWLVVGFGGLFLLLEVLVVLEAVRVLRRPLPDEAQGSEA